MRKFDCSDRDPAMTARDLAEFRNALRVLFVEEYVLCTTPFRVEGLGVAQTITQVAMEQFKDVKEFHVGKKVFSFWSKVSKKQCTEALKAIGDVSGDVMERLNADFAPDDLYMCLEAMDLGAWGSALVAAKQGQECISAAASSQDQTDRRQLHGDCVAVAWQRHDGTAVAWQRQRHGNNTNDDSMTIAWQSD